MKKLVTATAVALIASTMSAHAFTVDDLRGAYSPSAFADADSDWRRITANRINECSTFGKNGKKRIDLIIDSYKAIGLELAAGDDSGAMAAAERLTKVINLNSRFEGCWNKVSRRAGVSREFRSLMR